MKKTAAADARNEAASRPNAVAGAPARGGGGEPQREGTHELVERVRGREVTGRDDVRDDRLEGGREERGADAVDRDYAHELPVRQRAAEGQRREHSQRRGAP